LEYWVAPATPRGARGVVRFNVMLNKDGTVKSASLVTDPAQLVAAAQAALMRWRYRTTLLNGEPVEVITVVDVVIPPPAEMLRKGFTSR